MDTLRQDLIYSLRSLMKAPRFTAVVIATLVLGIGANSAIFSVLNAVLLRPLPFPDAARVVNLAWDGSGPLQQLSSIKFQYWHDHARSFEATATWRSSLDLIDITGAPSSVRALSVSRGFFRVLGYTPALGRGFVEAEYVSGGPLVAIISHALWRTRFASAPGAVGQTIRLNGPPVTVVGVLPEAFAFPYEEEPVEVIVPLRMTVDPNDVAENWPTIVRLKNGVTPAQAQDEGTSRTASFRAAYPNQVSAQDRGMTLVTFSELYVDVRVRRAFWILMSAVTFVLLIACANVSNLFLARATERRREIAVHAALGATRARIARLVLTESVLVALTGGALGLMLGQWIATALVALTPTAVPRMASVNMDWRVLTFTVIVSLATSLLFGSVTAWPAARARLSEVLKDAARGSSGRSPVRAGLLVAQSALAMVLLVGAGLLVTTMMSLTSVDPGFDVEDVVAVRLPTKPSGYDTSQDLWKLVRRVLQEVEGSPVVASIAAASSLPLERGINTPMTVAGRPDVWGTVEWRAVSPSYFQTLGITLLAGRSFEETDGAGGPLVAIVNEAFAGRYFSDAGAIGQRIEVGRSPRGFRDPSLAGRDVEIVGIARDIREISLRSEPRRTIYVLQAQAPTSLSNVMQTMPVFVAKTRGSRADVERVLTQALRAADPALPTPQVFPLNEVVARSLARERFGATLLSVLAALALVLTALGIHGVLAYTVQQRRREIGIRMALGAGGREVTHLVMKEGVVPVLVGVVLGVVGAVGLSQSIAGFLWGVTPTDPATFGAVAVILLGVAMAASWIPARAAANLDPVNTLNCE